MSGGCGKSGAGFGLTCDESVAMIVRTRIVNAFTDPRKISYVLATEPHKSSDINAL